MPSTYSNLKIQLMATGENNTTWGDVTNLNLGTALEEAIVGSADVTFASGDVTLTLSDTNASQTARNMRLRCTGTTGGARNLIVPAIEKPYIVQNDCADAITVKNSTGTGIAVPAGKTLWVYNNGTNVVDAVTHLSSLTLTSALPAASGGTGQNSYTTGDLLYASGATALAKLADVATGNALLSGGVGVAPAWGKIGLTTHVSGTLPVANGGTGTSTAFTTGSIVFAGASGVYSQDNANLFWDDTNNRLGLGTNAPASIGSNVTTVHARGTSGAGILFGSTSFASSASLWTSGDGSLTTLGTLTSMPLAFSTNSSERMRIDSSGNVGIGTSSPNSFAGYTYITTAGTNGSGIYFRQGATDLGLVDVYANAMHVFSQGAYPLALGTDNTERMRISSAGYVGIGTSAPSFELDVKGAGATTSARIVGGGITTAPASGGTLTIHTLTNAVARTGLDISFTDGAASRVGGFKFSDTQTAGDWVACQMEMVQSFGAANEIVSKLQVEDASWAGMRFVSQTNAGAALATSPTFIWRNYTTEQMRITAAGDVLVTGGGGLGYGTGSGGTVTQATSRTTGVTLNKTTGSITLVSAAGTTAWQSFTVTNSTIAANDTVIVNQRSGTDLYMIHVTNVAAGSFRITFATTGGTTTEQPVFNFAVIKGATS